MNLTVRLFGADTGYDHDVATTSLDAEPCGDLAMGFTPGWVGE